jgi:hypothetical protein
MKNYFFVYGRKTVTYLSVVFVCFLPQLLTAQLSPGELTQVHSHLEGMSNCTQCHELGQKISNDKCLACHKPLKARTDAGKGYHSSTEIKGKQCIKCHSDHNGKKFEIIRFNKDNFDHALTGFKLQGAHKEKKCDDCHKKDFIAKKEIRDKKFTFLGLNTKCLNCHEDQHQKTLSTDCTNCHNNNKFKPADKFEHDKAKFTLKGKHKEVDCSKCHKTIRKSEKPFQQFAGLEFKNCSSCHEDVHKNKFGQNCTKCHNESSFHVIAGLSGFNHNKTNFPLNGQHRNLDCKKCHKTKLTDPVKHNNCYTCHEDYHEGQLIKNNIKTDCKECHTTNSFKNSSFGIESHSKTKFKLEGAHMATPCFACHKKNNAEKWTFRIKGEKCVDCHEDRHYGFISEKYYPETNCLSCHKTDTWSDVAFDHAKTKFKLDGAHKNKTCRDCHFKPNDKGKTIQKFKTLKSDCLSCHKDEHAGQFDENGKTDCLKCHQNNNWKPDKFNHSKTHFALEGKHANLACAKCHKPKTIGQTKVVEYKLKSYKCESCH